jgi:hypothetical protein
MMRSESRADQHRQTAGQESRLERRRTGDFAVQLHGAIDAPGHLDVNIFPA